MNDDTALVVVDMQNDFCDPKGIFARRGNPIIGADAIANNIALLIDASHDAGVPVYFVRTVHDIWSDTREWESASRSDLVELGLEQQAVCTADSWGAEYFAVAPTERDREVIKHRYSAFYGTSLGSSLRARGRSRIVITGVATNVCVESTGRDACMADLQVVVPSDACAASSAEEHRAGLYNIATYFGSVCTTAELLVGLRNIDSTANLTVDGALGSGDSLGSDWLGEQR